MTHSPARVLAHILHSGVVDSGESLLFNYPDDNVDWCLYVSALPDQNTRPKAAAVYDTSPRKLGRLLDGTELWAWGIQFKLRSPDYAAGWTKAEALSDLLEEWHDETITIEASTYVVEYFSQTSRVLPIGQDEQQRHLFTINGLCVISETTATPG